MIQRRCGAEQGVAVVAVDALEFDGAPVEIQHAVPDADVPEAQLLHDVLTAAVQDQRVQQRLLVAPQLRRVNEEVKSSLAVDLQ